MKKASKRRILFAARMATMVGAACFAVSGISETLGQEKEKSRPVYIATEEVAERRIRRKLKRQHSQRKQQRQLRQKNR